MGARQTPLRLLETRSASWRAPRISGASAPEGEGQLGAGRIPAGRTHHVESGRWVSRRVRATGLSEKCASCSAAPALYREAGPRSSPTRRRGPEATPREGPAAPGVGPARGPPAGRALVPHLSNGKQSGLELPAQGLGPTRRALELRCRHGGRGAGARPACTCVMGQVFRLRPLPSGLCAPGGCRRPSQVPSRPASPAAPTGRPAPAGPRGAPCGCPPGTAGLGQRLWAAEDRELHRLSPRVLIP